ncbi:MAG: oligosaccharide flippase family protein [Candidatus Thiodiazotropha sp.]
MKNTISKGIVLLASGTAGAQMIVLIAMPFLTRIYNPEQFGILSVYSSIISILIINAALRYEQAIPLVDDETEAFQLLVLSLALTFIIATILFAFGQFGIFELLPARLIVIDKYWIYVPIGFLFAGLYQILVEWGVRERTYGVIMKTKVTQATFQVGVQCAIGYFIGATYGLLLGHVIGLSAGISRLVLMLKDVKQSLSCVKYKSLMAISRKHINYPKYLALAGFFNVGARYMPSIIIAWLYGATIAGFFFLAERVLNAPLLLISDSIGKVVYGECAKLHRENASLSLFIRKAILILSIVGGFLTTIIFFFSELIFSFVFGSEWLASGYIASVLSLLFLFRFVTSPLAKILNIYNMQRINMYFQIMLFMISISSLIVAEKLDYGYQVAIALYSISASIIYFLYILFLNNVVGLDNRLGKEHCA